MHLCKKSLNWKSYLFSSPIFELNLHISSERNLHVQACLAWFSPSPKVKPFSIVIGKQLWLSALTYSPMKEKLIDIAGIRLLVSQNERNVNNFI